MFMRLTPFFQLDDGGSDGWSDTIASAAESLSASDEQPAADSDAESLVEGEPVEGVEDPAPDEAEAPVEETEKPDDQTLSEDSEVEMGEGRQPVKLSELKQGYLRQSDYTKKTQALAEERKTFDAEREQMAPIKQMSDFLNMNPYLRDQIQTFIKEFTQSGYIPIEEALADAQYGQYINTLMAEKDRLAQENAELKGKYGELEFGTGMDKAISDLRAEYGDLITPEYEQQLRQQAHDENLKPDMLKRLAKGDLAEMKLKQNTKKAKDIEAETIQTMQEKRNSLPPQPRSRGQKPGESAPDLTGLDWLQIAKLAGSKT